MLPDLWLQHGGVLPKIELLTSFARASCAKQHPYTQILVFNLLLFCIVLACFFWREHHVANVQRLAFNSNCARKRVQSLNYEENMITYKTGTFLKDHLVMTGEVRSRWMGNTQKASPSLQRCPHAWLSLLLADALTVWFGLSCA